MQAINPGDLLAGQFRIERELGSGAFGRTYLAHDVRLDDKVVVKELLERWVRTADIRQRFVNEAQAMRRLKHPNIVTVYDLLTPDAIPGLKQLYIVMEFMAGGSLEGRMRKGLKWEEAVAIAIRVRLEIRRATG